MSACILYSVVYKYAFGGNLVSWFPLKCFLHTISAREDLRRAEALTTECWCRKLSVRAPDHLGCFLVCFPCCSCQSPASRRCPLLSLPFLHWPFFPLDTRILFEHLSPLGRQKPAFDDPSCWVLALAMLTSGRGTSPSLECQHHIQGKCTAAWSHKPARPPPHHCPLPSPGSGHRCSGEWPSEKTQEANISFKVSGHCEKALSLFHYKH